MLGQSLLDLPLHVLTEVLSYLDSIPSLGSAILSHSALYAAYKEQSTNIIECIVLNQIPSDLMPYAVATYDATRVNHRSLDDIVNLLRNYFSDVAPSRHFVLRLEHLEPSAAHLISKTHCAVLHFSNAFIADTLPLTRRRLGYHRSSYARASTIELFRIRRALYRFQLYCNLTFRGENDLRRDREQRLTIYRYQSRFFNYFSPWVNEQFACIHDFLERVLSTCKLLKTSPFRPKHCPVLLNANSVKRLTKPLPTILNGVPSRSTGSLGASRMSISRHMYVLQY